MLAIQPWGTLPFHTMVGSAGHHSLTASSTGRQSIIVSHLEHRKPGLDRIPSLTNIHVYSSHILDASFDTSFGPALISCSRQLHSFVLIIKNRKTSLGKIKLCTPRSCSAASSLTTASSLVHLHTVLPLRPIIGNLISNACLFQPRSMCLLLRSSTHRSAQPSISSSRTDSFILIIKTRTYVPARF